MKSYLILLLLYVSHFAFGQNEQLLTAIKELQQQKKYDSAIVLTDSLISLDPTDIKGYLLKGKLLNSIGITQESVIHMEEMLKVAPPNAALHSKYAFFLYDLEQYNKADTAYYKAYNLCVGDTQCCNIKYYHAKVKLKLQQYDESKQLLLECLAIFPQDFDYLLDMSHSRIVAGHNKEGLKYALMANDVKKDNRALNNIALVYNLQGKHEDAIAIFQYLVKMEPNNYVRKNNLGYSYVSAGQLDIGIKYIKEAIEGDPSNSYAYRNLGLAYLNLKQKDVACQYFYKAIALGFTQKHGQEVESLINKNCQ
jgi:tetratricopeptide (TPR) repeat protein